MVSRRVVVAGLLWCSCGTATSHDQPSTTAAVPNASAAPPTDPLLHYAVGDRFRVTATYDRGELDSTEPPLTGSYTFWVTVDRVENGRILDYSVVYDTFDSEQGDWSTHPGAFKGIAFSVKSGALDEIGHGPRDVAQDLLGWAAEALFPKGFDLAYEPGVRVGAERRVDFVADDEAEALVKSMMNASGGTIRARVDARQGTVTTRLRENGATSTLELEGSTAYRISGDTRGKPLSIDYAVRVNGSLTLDRQAKRILAHSVEWDTRMRLEVPSESHVVNSRSRHDNRYRFEYRATD